MWAAANLRGEECGLTRKVSPEVLSPALGEKGLKREGEAPAEQAFPARQEPRPPGDGYPDWNLAEKKAWFKMSPSGVTEPGRDTNPKRKRGRHFSSLTLRVSVTRL